MNKFVIVVIAYDRPDSLNRLLTQLFSSCYNNHAVDLVVSIDKGPFQQDLVELCGMYDWQHGTMRIVAHEQNQGLKNHVLMCGDLVADYDALIMFEDDIFPSTSFFEFTLRAIELADQHKCVAGVSLYTPMVNEFTNKSFIPHTNSSGLFLAQVPQSWGQAWSKKMWFEFRDWLLGNEFSTTADEQMPLGARCWSEKSWKKLFFHYMVTNNKYFLYSSMSLSTNFYEIGTHVKRKSTQFQVPLLVTDYEFDLDFPDHRFIYDSFYENDYLKTLLKQKYNKEVVVDLYGTKAVNTNTLILTTKRLPYRIVRSYALDLKPHELNVLWDLKGDGIFLYDTSEKFPALKKTIYDDVAEIKYYHLNDWRSSLKVVVADIFLAIRVRLRKWIFSRF